MGFDNDKARRAQRTAAALAASGRARAPRALADDAIETHGLSSFGDLALPPDFKHFAYVNPDAPKGGLLSLQITTTARQPELRHLRHAQHFFQEGRRRGGHVGDLRHADERQRRRARFGLRPASRAPCAIPRTSSTYRFLLRPEARFADGSKVTRRRRRVLARRPQGEGASDLFAVAERGRERRAPRPRTSSLVRFVKERTPRRASHRRRHADLLRGVVEGTRLRRRDARGAARLRRLSGQDVRTGPLHRIRAATTTIGARTCRSTSAQNNFQRLRFEYYRERQVAFEAFKAGAINFHQEYTSRIWATGYDFAAVKDGRVKKEALHNGAPTGSQGWYFNTRREQFKDPRVREALGLGFDFEWTNKNVMFSSYKRVVSYFQNSRDGGGRPAGPRRTRAARAAARQDSRLRVRRTLHAAGQRRLGQRPRAAQARQRNAARRRLQARRRRSAAAERRALHDRVPRFLRRLCSRTSQPFQQNLQKARHRRAFAHRRRRAIQEPHRELRLRRRRCRLRRQS